MILALSIRLASKIHAYMYAYAPSNVLIRYLRSAEGRRWALPVSAALAVGYLVATAGLNVIIESGSPGWLNLVTLTCCWNAIKFAMTAGTVTMGSLVRRLFYRGEIFERRSLP